MNWVYRARHDSSPLPNLWICQSIRERWICGSGQSRSGQFGTILQGWNLQEWTNQHDVARVDIAGVVKCPWKMCSRQVESHRLYVRSTHSGRFRTQRSICTSKQRVFYLTRRAVEDKHDGDRFERLRYDSKRPRICLCLRKSVVQ